MIGKKEARLEEQVTKGEAEVVTDRFKTDTWLYEKLHLPKWSQSEAKVKLHFKWSFTCQSEAKVKPKWSQSEAKVKPKRNLTEGKQKEDKKKTKWSQREATVKVKRNLTKRRESEAKVNQKWR